MCPITKVSLAKWSNTQLANTNPPANGNRLEFNLKQLNAGKGNKKGIIDDAIFRNNGFNKDVH